MLNDFAADVGYIKILLGIMIMMMMVVGIKIKVVFFLISSLFNNYNENDNEDMNDIT